MSKYQGNQYSYNNQEPTEIPETIILSDGTELTDSNTYTEADIIDAGYLLILDHVHFDPHIEIPVWCTTYRKWTKEPKHARP